LALGPDALAVSLLVLILVALASAAALAGFRMFRPLVNLPGASGRRVSIIVAAKNEADTLRECLSSLVGLEYPEKEVIVVCGPSTDGTEAVAREFSNEITVLLEPERPADWVGKSWACHQGYLRSTGDVLLFTDGDVVHSKQSLGIVLANLESEKADFLSGWPKIRTRPPSEKVLFPATLFFLCAGVAAGAERGTQKGRRVDGANGQYIMVTRKAYDAIGGHQSIKADIMEDSAMGRKALRQGLEVVNFNGEGYLEVKPYSGLREILEAHERFGAGLLPEARELAGALVLTLAYFVGPFALLAAALEAGDFWVGLTAAVATATVFATLAFFSARTSRVWYFLLAPLAGLIVLAALVVGFVRFRRSGITWKGVRYASDRFKPLARR